MTEAARISDWLTRCLATFGLDRDDPDGQRLCQQLSVLHDKGLLGEAVAGGVTTGHTLSVVIEDGYMVLGLACHAPEGADCRLACPLEDCAETEYPHEGPEGDEHELVDRGECNATLWLDNSDDVTEAHTGEPEPLVDGMAIKVDWDGDGYVWHGLPSFASALEVL